jgi:Zn-dependent peptidase ImmA (M78 family)
MPVRVDVAPTMLAWASERSGRDRDELHEKFPRLGAWESGDAKPTLKQLEKFASATYMPVGYLLLESPPDEPLPLPDFRTRAGRRAARPSPNLLDTIYACEQRQDWFRSYLVRTGADRLPFVGSLTTATGVGVAAARIQEELHFGVEDRRDMRSWSEALREFAERTEDAGILVMISGIVGSNTHRTLDPDEFGGFALVDELVPVVFVNGADTKAAQIFTLAHELAHVWLGQAAVSNARLTTTPNDRVERWCNAVAAEFLIPEAALRDSYDPNGDVHTEAARLAREFKVSTLVALRRIFDADYISWDDYQSAFEEALDHIRDVATPTGGNFYNVLPVRASKRFTRAVVTDTLEGNTLYKDAFHLLGVRKQATFSDLGEHLGVT